MSTMKTNLITNTTGTRHLDLEDQGYPLSAAWSGMLLDETTTPKLSEVGIQGLNPLAYVYPDGTITGESDNGKFTKKANGDIIASSNTVLVFISEYATPINGRWK